LYWGVHFLCELLPGFDPYFVRPIFKYAPHSPVKPGLVYSLTASRTVDNYWPPAFHLFCFTTLLNYLVTSTDQRAELEHYFPLALSRKQSVKHTVYYYGKYQPEVCFIGIWAM
jgi:hypothetical protein